MKNLQVYKYSRRLPTSFIVAGISKRCTIHEFGCPTDPCPYRTNNKKIVETIEIALASKKEQKTLECRSRVFYRDDMKSHMKNIFMTNDDAINSRFEPFVGSLKPSKLKLVGQGKSEQEEIAMTDQAFADKMGNNLSKRHPEVYKLGVL